MIDPNQDRELQARLLANHPAVKAGGVDPLWRWVALIGWVTVAVLVAVTARGEGKLEISNCQLSISNFEAKNFSPRGADTLGNLSRVTLTSAGIRGENDLSAWRKKSQSVPAGHRNAGQTVPAALANFTITEGWLDALECVESGMDAGAVGDQGRSRGSFQFKAVAWEQVNTLRKSQGLVRHSYRFGAHNRVTARIYAREYLRWLESYLIRALGRSPTSHELYAVWNLGPAGFRARGFDLRRCPEHVRRKATEMGRAQSGRGGK